MKEMTMSLVRRIGAVGATVALVLVPVVAEGAPGRPGEPRYQPGEPGAGDPYFPLAGNGGIDVLHYDLDLDYTPPAPSPAPLEGQLEGVATIDLVATQDLDRFNLDLRGLTATSVVVNGKSMDFTQEENELVITPRPKLKAGAAATVVVTYGGTTTRPTDIEGALYGWVTTRDGAMVVSEPDGAATWFPVSDHPTDKATYSFEITVPEGLVAAANGLPVGEPVTEDGRTTWRWDAPDPMAAYLATATVGNFDVLTSTGPGGLPIIDFLDKDLTSANRTASERNLALTPDMIAFFEELYGPYPFVSYGAIVDDDNVGYALETQTRSFFSRSAGESTIAHELAHQWMGDHVSPERWADIWLNEGWATYSAWMWTEERGGNTAEQSFTAVMNRAPSSATWQVKLSDPGALNLFSTAVYDRGAAALHALRVKIGDEAFFELARTWVERYGGGTASTDDFRALAEEVSGQDLDTFFTVWLDTVGKPTSW
jgi:aminopeptidase N